MIQPDLKLILLLDENERRRRINYRGVLNGRDEDKKNPNTRLGFFEDYLLQAAKNAPEGSVVHIDTGILDVNKVTKKIFDHLITK